MADDPYELDWDDPQIRKTRIGWIFDRIIQSVEETFQSYGIDLPTLRYSTMGNPVHDCEQLTVSLIQAYVGAPGDQAQGPQQCQGPRSAVFQVELVRCFEDGSSKNLRADKSTAPKPEVINSYTQERAIDLWALLDSSEVLPDYNGVIADVAMGDPEGGYQAAILNLVIQI